MKIPKIQKRKTRRSNRSTVKADLTKQAKLNPVNNSDYEYVEFTCEECNGSGQPASFGYVQSLECCTEDNEFCHACGGVGVIIEAFYIGAIES